MAAGGLVDVVVVLGRVEAFLTGDLVAIFEAFLTGDLIAVLVAAFVAIFAGLAG